MTEVAFHKIFVRLACVRHAASVRPEPGSNSLKIVFLRLSVKIILRAQSLIYDTSYRYLFPCFVSEIWIWFVLSVLKFLSRFLFFRCLIFKVRIAPKSCSISSPAFALAERSYIIPNHFAFVNTFFKTFFNFSTLPRVYHYTYTFYSALHLILWFFTIFSLFFCFTYTKISSLFFTKSRFGLLYSF